MQYQYESAVTENYQGEQPAFIWSALDELYHSIFCSEPHLRLHSSVGPQTQSWVVRASNTVKTVLLFDICGRVVRVLNEVVALENKDIDDFSNFIFEKYKKIKIIQFHAIYQIHENLKSSHTKFIFSEDFILDLPAAPELWLKKLSRKMRDTLRYQLRRSLRKEPDLSFRIVHTTDITADLVHQIIAMNRVRMQKKGKACDISDLEEHQLVAVMRERGLIYLMEINGKVIAGLLCTFCHKDIFFHVIGHDTQYDNLRIGLLCCYQTIVAAIQNGCNRIHFLWGRYQYKLQLGAAEKKLIKMLVFRNAIYKFQRPDFYRQKIFIKFKYFIKDLLMHFKAP